MKVAIVLCTLLENPPEIIQDYENYEVIYEKERIGLVRSRNKGWKRSNADIIMFIDDDIKLRRDTLKKSVELFKKDQRIGLIGIKAYHNFNGRTTHLWSFVPWVNDIKFISGSCMIFRRTCLEEIGGFNERYPLGGADDLEITLKVEKYGWKLQVLEDKVYGCHFHTQKKGFELQSELRNKARILNNLSISKTYFPDGIPKVLYNLILMEFLTLKKLSDIFSSEEKYLEYYQLAKKISPLFFLKQILKISFLKGVFFNVMAFLRRGVLSRIIIMIKNIFYIVSN